MHRPRGRAPALRRALAGGRAERKHLIWWGRASNVVRAGAAWWCACLHRGLPRVRQIVGVGMTRNVVDMIAQGTMLAAAREVCWPLPRAVRSRAVNSRGMSLGPSR